MHQSVVWPCLSKQEFQRRYVTADEIATHPIQNASD